MSVYVPLADFRRAVDAYVALVGVGACEAVAMPPASNQVALLYIDQGNERVEETLAASDVQLELLFDARMDVQDALAAAISNVGAERFAAARSEPRGLTEEIEDAETAKQKYDLVANGFDLEPLVRQVQLKGTSKNPLLWTMEWELVSKLEDDDFELPGPPGTFATFRVVVRPPLFADGTGDEL